jgi:hypothetical protein
MPLVIQPLAGNSLLKPDGATNGPIPHRGLTSADARHRLETLGSNAIADVSQHHVRRSWETMGASPVDA